MNPVKIPSAYQSAIGSELNLHPFYFNTNKWHEKLTTSFLQYNTHEATNSMWTVQIMFPFQLFSVCLNSA